MSDNPVIVAGDNDKCGSALPPPPPAYSAIYPAMTDDKYSAVNDTQKVANGFFGVNNDVSQIIKAVDMAARRHRGQRRKDVTQTPYINHPIGVAFILTNEAQVTDTTTITAAILHDIVEDTKTTDDEIRQIFGDEVGFLRQFI
ncbi:unnamed protein product [Gongylonema pulchrum]|uniref:HD domain-containing protein n=1 Tax=Gongylonema pulchrum TaxID=637853 RepID=A0A183DPZ5_9BILA|nr:unnamed protein product [Gongylonema pulchrum]